MKPIEMCRRPDAFSSFLRVKREDGRTRGVLLDFRRHRNPKIPRRPLMERVPAHVVDHRTVMRPVTFSENGRQRGGIILQSKSTKEQRDFIQALFSGEVSGNQLRKKRGDPDYIRAYPLLRRARIRYKSNVALKVAAIKAFAIAPELEGLRKNGSI